MARIPWVGFVNLGVDTKPVRCDSKYMDYIFPKKLELVPIETLRPYEKNSRIHSPEQIQQIANSIKEFGFTQPILVDGTQGIIAGHGRLEAAKLLGLSNVPVVMLDYLSEAQKKAYIIADNKLTLNADWDYEILSSELTDLKDDIEFDLALVGFSDDELADLLPDLDDADFEKPKGQPIAEEKQDEEKKPDVIEIKEVSEKLSKKHKCPNCQHEFE